MPRLCMYNTINGCPFAYDPASPADMASYAAHLEGHAHSGGTTTLVNVPDLITMSQFRPDTNPVTEAEAERELQSHNLRLGTVRVVDLQRRHLGVISMAPTPGSSVPEWTEVDLVINEAAATHGGVPAPIVIPPGAFAMPEVDNLTLDEANAILPKGGKIKKENVEKAYSDDVKEGRIISASTAVGQPVYLNDPRNPRVTVSAGKNPRDRRKLVPDWF